MKEIIDLTRDLAAAASMGPSHEQVDRLLGEGIDALGKLVPFDLATVMELRGEDLKVRLARGALDSPDVRRHSLSLERFGSIRELLETGRARAFTEDDHGHGDGDAFDGVLDLPHGHSCMVVPLRVGDEAIGVMTFDRQECVRYPDEVVELASVFGRLVAVAMRTGDQSELLARLHGQASEQNRFLSERVEGRTDACRLLEASRSAAMTGLVRLAQQVAATDTPVLITGETGTGKEVLANALHGWSARRDRPLVSLNCAALPPGLIESELFGHVKGAFSGATTQRMGRFQAANGGTLFLDEIGELPMELQPKLLRALQEGCFEPVGSDRTVRVDVRIIAATNVDLGRAIGERRFREDLFYRLAVFPLHVPPLRHRREDIAPIAEAFLASLARRRGRGPWRLADPTLRWLEAQPWPGNVRELVNVLERASILGSTLPAGAELTLGHAEQLGALGSGPGPGAASGLPAPDDTATGVLTLEEMERRHIERTLRATGGRLYGKGGCAELLGVNPSTLRSRMKKLGLGGAREFKGA